MSNYKMIKWNSNINVFIFFLLGLLLLIFPIESMSISGYLIASILMLGSLSYIIKIYRNKNNLTNGDIIYLIISLVALSFSISIFIDPTWIIRILNILIGLLLIISAIINFKNILSFNKNRSTSWWIYVVLIILIFVFGITIIINPLFLAKVITRIAGVALIINALTSISLNRKVNNNLMIKEIN